MRCGQRPNPLSSNLLATFKRQSNFIFAEPPVVENTIYDDDNGNGYRSPFFFFTFHCIVFLVPRAAILFCPGTLDIPFALDRQVARGHTSRPPWNRVRSI